MIDEGGRFDWVGVLRPKRAVPTHSPLQPPEFPCRTLWGKAKLAAPTFQALHNPLKWLGTTVVVFMLKVPQLRQAASATGARAVGRRLRRLSLCSLLGEAASEIGPLRTLGVSAFRPFGLPRDGREGNPAPPCGNIHFRPRVFKDR